MAVITISREYGSGGDELAPRICELLGYRYFDKTWMARVASEVGLSETGIVDFSEEQLKVRGFVNRSLGERHEIVSQARVWQEDTRGVRSLQVAELDPVQSITLVQGTIESPQSAN
jgi:cytidylate kinase